MSREVIERCPACGRERGVKWQGSALCRRCIKRERLEARTHRQRVDAARRRTHER